MSTPTLTTTSAVKRAASHAAPYHARAHKVAARHPKHHRHFFESIGHGISQAARGVGHAAAHVGSLFHHHTAASVSVAVVIAVVVAAAVTRVVARDAAVRIARWLSGADRRGPSKPGPGSVPPVGGP